MPMKKRTRLARLSSVSSAGRAGSVEGFKYSDAMKESGVIWDKETLAAYVADPKGYVPGNKMAFAGLKKEQEIADLIAYLQEVTAQ